MASHEVQTTGIKSYKLLLLLAPLSVVVFVVATATVVATTIIYRIECPRCNPLYLTGYEIYVHSKTEIERATMNTLKHTLVLGG